ncbi:hypothetical protein GGD83_002714 [Rhodoblastus sphagnicola]|uniref:STN domain-containing protein n=1 Tax=Rhodoblastus sphagnicola TaxID=333368 RepID=UPI0011B00946|nr:STN domain-containing protein [Rhodoblastus sphagnicola]MBB4198903.1 hypothetical protein [Rhodoblastus sphagnicola]
MLNSVSLPFDIPAQSLAPALGAFSAASHLELYYESSLVEGHRSSAVSGSFSPDIALGRLLRGTGLSVESFVPGTATILPARPAAQAQDLAALKSKTVEFSSYFSRIQVSLRAAFCKSPALQADPSELIVRLWIASSGAIALAELRQPTGVEERDRAYVAAMRSLVVGQAPPPDMPQPVTIMVLPRTSRAAAQCPPADSAASGRVLVHE